jgi:carboxylesterase type B
MNKSQNTVVETSAGKVEGLRRDELYHFMGIPYASPPVGEKRWLAPEPVEPWTGVRQAQSWGGVAPQNPPEAEIQRQRKNSAYNYLFTWSSPLLDGRLGACHALELGFLFGTYEENFSGAGPAADALARKIQDAWLAFAHTGDPSCESLGNWPAYGDKRETMMLGERCGVEEAPHDEERRVWDTIPNAVIGSL